MFKVGVWLFLMFFLNALFKMPLKKFNNPHSNDLRKLPHRMKTASETIKCPVVCKNKSFSWQSSSSQHLKSEILISE